MKQSTRIAISIGDTNGIGPEVVLKTLLDGETTKDLTPIVFASEDLLQFYMESCGISGIDLHPINHIEQAKTGVCNVFPAWSAPLAIEPGQPTAHSGRAAFQSLEMASQALVERTVDALVTAPIDKHNIQSDAFSFPGHTEYLAAKVGREQVLMFLVSEDLRIGVCTGHVPLSEVRESLSKEVILNKLRMMDASLKSDFGIDFPRIAVLGLNPHAGDNGLIGSDENDLILPALEKAKAENIDVFGPFPSDGLFGSGAHKKYDAVLGMYHDQGLIPFKMAAFEEGVNFTAGLPILRTSPDHGTAFDIAGKGIASPVSFKEAE